MLNSVASLSPFLNDSSFAFCDSVCITGKAVSAAIFTASLTKGQLRAASDQRDHIFLNVPELAKSLNSNAFFKSQIAPSNLWLSLLCTTPCEVNVIYAFKYLSSGIHYNSVEELTPR